MIATTQGLRVTVVARQPLALGAEAEVAFFTSSHQFVPGTVLRGALAAAWIAEHGTPTGDNPHVERFRSLFDGDIRFGPLLVENSTRTPMSVHKCKYPLPECGKEVVVDAAFETGTHCPGCRRRLEASKGELVMPDGFAMHRSTRTELTAGGTAEKGSLFSQGALPIGTTLVGHIYGHDAWLEDDRSLWLGGRRSVGGHAEYSAKSVDLPLPVTPADRTSIVVRLLSTAIFVDTAGRSRLDPDPVLDLGFEPDTVPVSQWTRPATWSGWHAASGLPKPTELCAAAGSTYRIEGPPDALDRFARRAVACGVGLRRAEGFGVVEIATAPWRPESPASHKTETKDTDVDPAVAAFERVNALQLKTVEQRQWLLGVLRGLQVARLSPRDGVTGGATDAATDADPVTESMRQPTARGLSAHQRGDLNRLLVSVNEDKNTLRDLTTLVDVFLVNSERAGQ